MRRAPASTFLFLALLGAAPAHARFGVPDASPGQTLLLPYFEVDLDNPQGSTTSMVINNLSATAVILKVSVWTDLGVHVTSFPLYLTGHDAADVDLRMLVESGTPPESASAGQDRSNDISPQGPFSQDINFASCTGGSSAFPSLEGADSTFLPQVTFSAARQAHVRAALTGNASALWGGRCGGSVSTGNVARGYITVHTYIRCDVQEPGTGGTLDDLPPQNHLAGEFTLVRRAQGLSLTAPLVTLQHAGFNFTGPARDFNPSAGSFWGARTTQPNADRVEPLPTHWQARFVRGNAPALGPFSGGSTSLLVWRDPGARVEPFTCGMDSAVGPLDAQVLSFNEQEDVQDVPGNLFPRVANLVPLDASSGLTHASGVLHLNLAHGARAHGAYVMSAFTGTGNASVLLPAASTGRGTRGIRVIPERVVIRPGDTATITVLADHQPTTGLALALATPLDPLLQTSAGMLDLSSGSAQFTVSVAPGAMLGTDPRTASLQFLPVGSGDAFYAGQIPVGVLVNIMNPASASATVSNATVTEGADVVVNARINAVGGTPSRYISITVPTIVFQSSHPDVIPHASFQFYQQVNLNVRTVNDTVVNGTRMVTLTPHIVADDAAFRGMTLAPINITVNDND